MTRSGTLGGGSRGALLLAASTVAVCAVGCGTPPKASIGDPAVLTTLHLRMATDDQIRANDSSGTQPSVSDSLGRYYFTKSKDYDGVKRRIDDKLEAVQRGSTYLQAVAVTTAVDFKLAMKSLDTGKADPPAPGKTPSTPASPPAAGNPPAGGTPPAAGGGASSAAKPAVAGAPGAATPGEGSPGSDNGGTDAGDGGGKPDTGNGGAGEKTTSDAGNGGKDPTTGGAQTPPADQLAQVRQDLKDLASTVTDSPTDELDRVTDFFAAYQLKLLKLEGDGRVVPPDSVAQTIRDNANMEAAKDPKAGNADQVLPQPSAPTIKQSSRLIYLYFQAQIDPGTVPNRMVGVKVTVDDAETVNGAPPLPEDQWQGLAKADLVKVLRLHPTRSYDLDQVAFGETIAEAANLTSAITAPEKIADVNLATSRNASLNAEQLRRFMSRVGKSASYADASTHSFGWNFYPSNLQVVRTGLLEGTFNFLFGVPREYKTEAYLDGGARDCSVLLLVPQNLRMIRFKVSNYHAYLNPQTGSSGGRTKVGDDQSMTVALPIWSPYETTTFLSSRVEVASGEPAQGAPANPGNASAPQPSGPPGPTGPATAQEVKPAKLRETRKTRSESP